MKQPHKYSPQERSCLFRAADHTVLPPCEVFTSVNVLAPKPSGKSLWTKITSGLMVATLALANVASVANADQTITSGTFVSVGTSAAGAVVFTGGTVNNVISGTLAIGTASPTTTITSLTGGTFTSLEGGTTGVTTIVIQSGAFGGVISDGAVVGGTVALTKSGTGTLVLSGTSTYSGGTNLQAGLLILGDSAAIGAGSLLTITGGSLSLPGITSTNVIVLGSSASVTLGQTGVDAGTLSGNLSFGPIGGGAVTLTVNSPITLSGLITTSGTATSLVIKGAGLLSLGNVGSIYNGDTTLDGGHVLATNANAFGITANAVVLKNGAQLSTDTVLANNISFGVLGQTSALEVQIGDSAHNTALSGTLSVQQAGTLYLGAPSSTGTTTISGSVQLNRDITLNLYSAATISGTIYSGTAAGASSNVTVTGAGVLTLGGSNTFSGTTSVTKGTVFASNSKAFGDGTVQLNDLATLNGNVIVANNVNVGSSTGSGTVNVTLGNGLTLSGTLKVNQVASISADGTLSGLVNLDKNATLTSGGNLTLSGSVKLGDSSILTLSGASASAVSAGTVYVTGTGSVIVNNDLTLGSHSGGITAAGSMTLASSGTGRVILAHTGATYLNSGGYLRILGYVTASNGSLVFNGGYLDLTNAPTVVNGSAIDYSVGFAAIPSGKTANIAAPSYGTVFSTPITGLGGLSLYIGKLTLAGTNTFTGETTVNGGTLVLPKKDSITTSSQVNVSGGLLNASQDGFTFRSGQLVKLSGGSFSVNAGSSNLSSANVSFENGGKLVLTGSLASATVIPVKKPVFNYSLTTPKPTFETAPSIGDVTVNNLDLGSPTYTLGAPTAVNPIYTIAYSVNAIGVSTQTVTRASYSTFASGKTATSLGAYLDAAESSDTAPALQDSLRNEIDVNVTSSATYTEILRQLSPQAFADMTRAGLERLAAVNAGLEDRMAAIATANIEGSVVSKNGVKAGSSAPSAPVAAGSSEGWGGWVSVYGRSGDAKADSAQGFAKMKNEDTGTQFGVENQVGTATVGLTGATGWGRSTFDNPSTQINSDSWHLGLYMVVPVGDSPLSIDGSVIYGLVSNDSTRTVSVSGLGLGLKDRSYKAKFDSRDLSISAGIAFNLMPKTSAFQLAPVLRMSVLNYSQNEVSESGVGVGNTGATHMDKIDATTFLTKLGVRSSYVTKVSASAEFGADASVYWQHDWDGKGRTANATLVGGVSGTSFSVTGRKTDQDTAVINGGLQMTFKNRYTIRGSGAVQTGDDTNLTGIVSLGIKF